MPSMAMTEQIYVRPIGQGTARPLGGALGSGPFFSPDGKWLGFWHAPTGTLRKVAVTRRRTGQDLRRGERHRRRDLGTR